MPNSSCILYLYIPRKQNSRWGAFAVACHSFPGKKTNCYESIARPGKGGTYSGKGRGGGVFDRIHLGDGWKSHRTRHLDTIPSSPPPLLVFQALRSAALASEIETKSPKGYIFPAHGRVPHGPRVGSFFRPSFGTTDGLVRPHVQSHTTVSDVLECLGRRARTRKSKRSSGGKFNFEENSNTP